MSNRKKNATQYANDKTARSKILETFAWLVATGAPYDEAKI